MRRFARYLLLAIMIAAAAPQLAQARAGGGSSMGSRGTRTYSTPSYGAAPVGRSNTAPTTRPGYSQPGYGTQPAYNNAYNNGSPFWRGLAGGFLGAGLAGMLFGHGGGGYGVGGGRRRRRHFIAVGFRRYCLFCISPVQRWPAVQCQ